MRIFLISIFFLTLTSCSVSESRKPSSFHVSNYSKDGVHFVEVDLLLTKSTPRVQIPEFQIHSIDFGTSKVMLNVEHKNNVSCYNGLRGKTFTSCSLNRDEASLIKLIYSFVGLKSFPVHEISWKEEIVKSHFSQKDIFRSKILKKVNEGRGLFLSEKLFLLKEYGDVEEVELVFPRRKTIKFSEEKPDLILVENLSSNLVHRDFGSIPLAGLMKADFLEDSFYVNKLYPFEFFCKRKDKLHKLDQDMILVEDIKEKDKLMCMVNTRLKSVFSRSKVKGAINFSVKSLNIESSFEELRSGEKEASTKLQTVIESIDKQNIDIIYNGLLKLKASK